MENLNLDNELLKPIKMRLENSINTLTKNAILTRKEAEITLKITVGVLEKEKEDEEYLEPSYEYQLTEKIKENKDSVKGHLGFNYKVEIDEENNTTVLKEINKQTSLF